MVDASAAYEVRTVDRLIAVNNHGDDGAEANRLYAQIMAELRRQIAEYGHPGQKIKASLSIAIDFTADHQGAIDVAITTKARLPAKPANKERFFLARDDILTLQDPARDSLFPGSDLGRARRAEAE